MKHIIYFICGVACLPYLIILMARAAYGLMLLLDGTQSAAEITSIFTGVLLSGFALLAVIATAIHKGEGHDWWWEG